MVGSRDKGWWRSREWGCMGVKDRVVGVKGVVESRTEEAKRVVSRGVG